MIGSGDLEKKCQELINLYKLEDNIDMIGFSNNPFKIQYIIMHIKASIRHLISNDTKYFTLVAKSSLKARYKTTIDKIKIMKMFFLLFFINYI